MKLRIKRIYNTEIDTERVVIEALEDCNLGRYMLFDTTYEEEGITSDKYRHLFVFTDLKLNEGDYVILYTRKQRNNDLEQFRNKRGTLTYNIFWNLEKKVWNNTGDKAYLVHYDSFESKGI